MRGNVADRTLIRVIGIEVWANALLRTEVQPISIVIELAGVSSLPPLHHNHNALQKYKKKDMCIVLSLGFILVFK